MQLLEMKVDSLKVLHLSRFQEMESIHKVMSNKGE
jgi:hypothetical protein